MLNHTNINWKYASLFILVLQNSMLILTMRYTRASVPEDKLYLASTAVLMSEVLKTLLCFSAIYYLLPNPSLKGLLLFLYRELFIFWKESIQMAIPAILYLIQNNLQYVAATNLDAATFQVTYQLKILTTAFFSVIILHRSLSTKKWVALGILTMGIALVVLPQDKETDTKTIDKSIGNQFNMKGLVSVIIACILSGVAGVYFEKIIKTNKQKGTGPDTNLPLNSDQSGALQLWVRNVQLCFFSVILGVFVMGLQDGPVILNHGFFQNYSGWTWIVIIIQALGGLIVALVVKYADNILKGFATCISIILSSTVSFFLFHFTVHPTFIMGGIISHLCHLSIYFITCFFYLMLLYSFI